MKRTLDGGMDKPSFKQQICQIDTLYCEKTQSILVTWEGEEEGKQNMHRLQNF